MMTPEPELCCGPITTSVCPSRRLPTGPYPVAKIWTTLSDTCLVSSWMDASRARSGDSERGVGGVRWAPIAEAATERQAAPITPIGSGDW